MGGRNRVVGSRHFVTGGPVARGRANLLPVVMGPEGDTGATGATGAAGSDGADGTQVITALEAGFDPGAYAVGDVVFLVDDIETPTVVKYGGKKGDDGAGGFPDPVVIT